MKTQAWSPPKNVIASYPVGRYVVHVYNYCEEFCSEKSEPVYSVTLDGRRIRCFTRSEERAFPKTPAMVGNAMVEAIKAERRT
jgi:hypothetical protein